MANYKMAHLHPETKQQLVDLAKKYKLPIAGVAKAAVDLLESSIVDGYDIKNAVPVSAASKRMLDSRS